MNAPRKTLMCLALAIFLCGTAAAEPFEDGLAAYQNHDFAAALRSWQEAAGQGNTRAMLNLGVMYDRGQGVREDKSEAVKWYEAAASAGIAEAQYYLGQKYSSGQGVSHDIGEAAKWYRRAAEQDHVPAQRVLGVLYLKGAGIERDYRKALNWVRKAVDLGDVQSFHNLGYMYQNGYGVPQDRAAAMAWYRKAAEAGLVRSQYNLGVMHMAASETAADYAMAEKWLRMAAEQGNAKAQTGLGTLYANGQGVAQDNVLAYMWFELAAEQGNQPAAEYREIVAERLNDDQLAEAGNRATEWLQQHTAVHQTASGLAPAAKSEQTAPAGDRAGTTANAIFYPKGRDTDSGESIPGSVSWSRLENDGKPPAIQARVAFSQPTFTLEVTISKNTDEYLPATHLVEITIGDTASVSDVPVNRIPALSMKPEPGANGTALVGAGVRVTDTIYWLALSEVPETAGINIALLRSGAWFEIPIQFADATRSLVVFEKGPTGKRVIEGVISDWGGPASAKADQ